MKNFDRTEYEISKNSAFKGWLLLACILVSGCISAALYYYIFWG